MTVNIKDRVAIDYRDGVADIRLNRPEKMNALDEAMFFALIEAAEHVRATKGVRAAVLSGAGRAFCAGLDMGRFEAMKNEGPALAGLRDLTARTHGHANHPQYAAYCWRELPVPVIAAVHGVALGGGFQVALGADMRFATPDVKLSILEIKWGLVPDVAGTQLMRHLAREDVVRELTYTGRVFNGEEGKEYGFVTRVCADPRAEALALAREIADKNPHAVRAAKRLLNLAVETDARAGLAAESKEQLRLIGSPNQIEAVRAAMEKRTPKFAEV